MSITVRIGDLPAPIKREVVNFLKSTNPPFKITDDLVITAVEEINGCTATNVGFYRIEVNGLIYGCDYYEDSWNSFDVLYYLWTTEPVTRKEGDIDEFIYCKDVAKIYYLLSATNLLKSETLSLKDVESYNESLIDKFVEENFCKWVIGMEFYDVDDKKWRKITGCGDMSVAYDIKENNKIVIDMCSVYGDLFSGSKKVDVWSPWEEDKRVTKTIKTHFDFYGRKIPVEVEIIGGEGTTL